MIVTDNGKTMTLAELAARLCHSFECDRYNDGGCPAASYCSVGHNGMLDWLRKVLQDDFDEDGRQQVYDRALAKNGAQLQSVVALEELSEAQKEICKCLRGCGNVDHLAEEVADATIMLEQIRMIYGIGDSVRRYMDAKVQRLEDRLKGGDNNVH